MTSPKGSVAEESGRWYERRGNRYLSVTNILSKSIAKDALVPCAVKLTADKANQCVEYVLANGALPPKKKVQRIRKGQPVMLEVDHPTYWKGEHTRVKDASAERGSIIHDWAEHWTLGHEPEPPAEYVAECLGIMRAFEKYDIQPIAAEATFYNNTYRYAGTGDLLATVGAWGGVAAMLDFKTGKNCWPETAYQLAAYRFGEFIGLADDIDVPVPETQAGGVLHVDHGTTRLIPYRCGKREFEVFTSMVEVAYEVVEEMKSVKDWAGILS